MLSNIPNGRSDKIICFLAFGIFWFINVNSVNYFKYIYLFLNSSLWTVLNYNTVKYFEGKKSLSNYEEKNPWVIMSYNLEEKASKNKAHCKHSVLRTSPNSAQKAQVQ